LSRIGRIFAQFEVNVHNAKIANIAERVEDFFYLTNADNQPITDPEICEQLTSEICKELDQHMQ
jgi:[protein-PII] uridylyltransferase